jgi:hypothetical protein
MEEYRMNKITGIKSKIEGTIMGMFMTGLTSIQAFAKTTESTDAVVKEVTGPITTLSNVLCAILAAIGGLMLIKAIADLVASMQQQDNSGTYHAGRSIAVALLMMSISGIVALFSN